MGIQLTREELKDLIREVVREELDRRQASAIQRSDDTQDFADIDAIATRLFDKYDDVFKALA